MEIPEMLEGLITEKEKQFFKQYDTELATRQIHQKDMSLAFHHIGHMRNISTQTINALNALVDKLIASNKALSESNDKHSRWMRWLTFALVFAALAQVAIAIFGS
jgi:hypothetical protein